LRPQASDAPARDNNVEGFKALMTKAEVGITGFLELLQDVPDEI